MPASASSGAKSPLSGVTDIITATILVGGSKIRDIYLIKEIQVHLEISRIPTARIVLIDGDPTLENFPASESDDFKPGAEIEIRVGYRDEETPIFTGQIIKHGIKVRDSGSFLVLSCMDKAAKLTIGRKNTLYLDQKDSDIISTIIQDAGLEADVAATEEQHKEIIRYYATDWDFLVSRAEANGHIVTVDGGKVTVKAPDAGSAAELVVRYGDALQEIDAEIDARTQLPSVKCDAWDFTSQSLASGDATEPELALQGNLSGADLAAALGLEPFTLKTPAPLQEAELKAWANARLLKSRLARVRGKVSFQGNATPKPGKVLELAGLGARFNGKAFVSAVTQRIEPGLWVTEVGFGLSPRWFTEEHPDIDAPLASGLLPGIHGLHIGKVKQIQDDPDGQTRIQVTLPLLDNGEALWARLANGYATQNAGFFFMPEVDDEVVLGFLNGDPNCPLILGSLYSSNRAPAYTPDADNTYKAIVTKNQVKIVVDDQKKEITVETPGGQTLVLSDDQKSITLKDSNDNKVALSADGIALESPKDISLKATGNIKLEASAGINIKAGTDLNLEGLNLNAKASAALAAQGQASAELSASGQCTVKGAVVMIN
jgi:Rhs element Vgr protein